jgi:hypothetical protein
MTTSSSLDESNQLGAELGHAWRPHHLVRARESHLSALHQPQTTLFDHRAFAEVETDQNTTIGAAGVRLSSSPQRSRSVKRGRRSHGGTAPRPENSDLARPENDAVLFLMAARQMLRAERVAEARRILEAASHISNSPMIETMRSLVAPPTVTVSDRRDVDRTREYDWLRAHGHEHRGLWLALNGEELVASAPTLRELRARLNALRVAAIPLIHRVY